MASSRWCFTLNNWTEEEFEAIKAWECKYMIVGKEHDEEGDGTPHLQGYVTLAKTVRLAAMKKLQARAHFEVAKGNSEQNKKYCTKEDEDAFEKGECPDDAKKRAAKGGEAEAARWKRAREIATTGGDVNEIPDDIYMRFYRTIKEMRKDFMEKAPDADDVTGVWYWGAAGVGKSRKAREDFPDSYLKMQNKWWDGYQQEETVILDDFDCKELGHHLKIWADRYAFIAETKGGAIQIRPKKIVITSNYPPEHFWEDKEMLAAIRRRFKITHFGAGEKLFM